MRKKSAYRFLVNVLTILTLSLLNLLNLLENQQ